MPRLFDGGPMAEWVTLAEVIAANVHDGETLALEGFADLIPFAAGGEIIRQQGQDETVFFAW
jgi:glutaconate CoA-transferase, subunit A